MLLAARSFATIPYDLLAEAVEGGGSSSGKLQVLGFLRTPRLLRLGRCGV